MKKKLFLTCLALACSALMFSCDRNGSDDPDNPDNPGGNGTTGQIVSNAVTDIDGNHYDAVWIDGKLWMKDNLKTTKFADGTPIELDGESGWTDEVLRFYPNDDASTVGTYGYLYDWYAVMHGNASSAANPSGVRASVRTAGMCRVKRNGLKCSTIFAAIISINVALSIII